MIKNSIILAITVNIFMTGCSMLPYRDSFQCERGKNSGVCASVSEVYEMSFDMDELKKRKLNQKEDAHEIKSEEDIKKDNMANETDLINENQKLKEILEAMQIKKLQERRPIIIQDNFSKIDRNIGRNTLKTSSEIVVNTANKMSYSDIEDDLIYSINQNVKVCTYKANIRKKPSCKARIVRVAKKDEMLYAEYEKNGWVKTNEGYIHKSIIIQK